MGRVRHQTAPRAQHRDRPGARVHAPREARAGHHEGGGGPRPLPRGRRRDPARRPTALWRGGRLFEHGRVRHLLARVVWDHHSVRGVTPQVCIARWILAGHRVESKCTSTSASEQGQGTHRRALPRNVDAQVHAQRAPRGANL